MAVKAGEAGQSEPTAKWLTPEAAAGLLTSLVFPDEDKKPDAREASGEGTSPDETPPSETERAAPDEEKVAEAERAEEPAPEPRKFRVKVDGKEIEVTEDELINGYSRTSDYTRKTQALADERKRVETDTAAVRAQREQYAQQLAQLEEALKDLGGKEPDWDKLRQETPDQFAAVYTAWKQHQDRITAVRAERAENQKKIDADRAQQITARTQQENAKLVEHIPEWADEAVAKREKQALVEYAKANNFSDEEIAAVSDHRTLLLLRAAYLHDRAQANKPKLKEVISKVKTATPGGGQPPKPKSDAQRARDRLAKSHRIEDAVAALADLV